MGPRAKIKTVPFFIQLPFLWPLPRTENDGGIDVGINQILNLGILESRNRMIDGDLILDYRFGVHINENVTISFIVDNLLNREYQTRPADLGAPRTYTLKISAKI